MNKTASAQQKVPLEAWFTLAILLFFNILANADQRIILILVEPMKADLGLSDFQMSLLLGPAFSLFYAVFGIPLGWAADRYPRKWVIYFGVSLWSLFTTMSGFVRTLGGLFFLRAAVGIGEASLAPAAYALLTDKFPSHRRSLALGIFSFAHKIGYSIALLLGGGLYALAVHLVDTGIPFLSEAKPWQLCFIMIGAPGILLAFLAHVIVEPKRIKAPAETEQARGLTAYIGRHRRTVIPLVLGYAFVALAAGSLLAWVPTYLQRQFDYSPVKTGTIMGFVGLLSLGLLILKALLTDWLYARGNKDIYVRLYLWVLILTLPASIIAFQLSSPISFLIAVGILQTFTLAFPLFQALTGQAIAPQNLRGRMAALFLVTTQAMFGIGPTIPAAINDYVLTDGDALGTAVGIATTVSLVAAILCLAYGLRTMRGLVEKIETENLQP